MVHYPMVQARAIAELEEFVGQSKLPTLDDRKALPYIDAMLWETMRWNPVTPLGSCAKPIYRCRLQTSNVALPHRALRDDVYDGYFIPAGGNRHIYHFRETC